MSPEEWLRERGIEVKRGHMTAQGDIASQFTGALPLPEIDDLRVPEIDDMPIDYIETQRLPAAASLPPVGPPVAAEPDIATLPTGDLPGHAMPPLVPANIRVVRVDSLDQFDDGIDLWPTVALPSVKTMDAQMDITQMPTRRLTS